jgi:hypothetical protein
MSAAETKSLAIRMPADVHERVRQAAKSSRRSMNGEIVFQLERMLEEKTAGAEFGDRTPAALETRA